MAGTGQKKGAKLTTDQEAARRRAFFDEWIANGRQGKKAALAVGIADGSAAQRASEWLKLPEFVEELARIDAKARAKSEITVEKQLERLNHIAGCDIAGIFDEHGAMKHPKDWPDGPRLSLASLDIEEVTEYDKEAGAHVTVGVLKKFKMWDKKGAIVDIMKHFPDGFAATKVDVKDVSDYGARMNAIIERQAKALAERAQEEAPRAIDE